MNLKKNELMLKLRDAKKTIRENDKQNDFEFAKKFFAREENNELLIFYLGYETANTEWMRDNESDGRYEFNPVKWLKEFLED